MTNISSSEPIINQESWLTEPSNLRDLLNQWSNLEDFEKFGVLIIRCPIEHQAQIAQQILITKKEESTYAWPEEYKFSETVSDECIEFADCQNLNEILERCFHAIRKFFSKIMSLSADLDQFRDEEPEDIGHIVIRLKVASTSKTVLKEYDTWANWTIQNLKPEDCARLTLTISRK
jgi:hypothetical protein